MHHSVNLIQVPFNFLALLIPHEWSVLKRKFDFLLHFAIETLGMVLSSFMTSDLHNHFSLAWDVEVFKFEHCEISAETYFIAVKDLSSKVRVDLHINLVEELVIVELVDQTGKLYYHWGIT